MSRLKLTALFGLILATEVAAHGGIPPAGIPGYPDNMTLPPWPNRQPACTEPGANDPCGLQSSCLSEPSRPLLPGENVYEPGKTFDVPWLISVVHGDGNQIMARLLNTVSGRVEILIEDFPQGDGRSAGDVIVISSLQIPVGFPPGAAVLEIWNQTAGDPYVDCLDLQIRSTQELVFFDGFES